MLGVHVEYVRVVFNESTKGEYESRQDTSQQSTQTYRHHTEKITLTTKHAINEKRRLEL